MLKSLGGKGDAEEAANFYAATFPDSEVTAVHKAPADFPGGKGGDVSSFSVPHSGNVTLGKGDKLTSSRSDD